MPMSDVAGAIRAVMEVGPAWQPAPYDIVIGVLVYEMGYERQVAHEAMFDAVMAGEVVTAWAKSRGSMTMCFKLTEEANA